MLLHKFKKKWRQRKYYSFGDFLLLFFGLLIESLLKRIPKDLFTRNNVITSLSDNGVEISPDGQVVKVNFEGIRYILRKKGSDFAVFNQIILYKELAQVVHYAGNLKKKDIVIMDCGANIGMSTLYFKKAFPNASIICAEPEKNNFEQLVKNINLNELNHVYPLQVGVWFQKSTLFENTKFRDGQDWSFSIREEGTGEPHIPVDSLVNIVSNAGIGPIDILKIDIEGAEFKLFQNLSSWASLLKDVKVLSVEIHEEFGAVWFIEEALLSSGFKIRRSGELLIGVRPEYV